MKTLIKKATENPLWKSHKIGNVYDMDKTTGWKIAYYPILEDGATGELYSEPRALIEKPSVFKGVKGTDFREVPLRYLSEALNLINQ